MKWVKKCASEETKDDRLKQLRTAQSRLKINNTFYLRPGMLQLANCCLEYAKARRASNILWERTPPNNCKLTGSEVNIGEQGIMGIPYLSTVALHY